MAGPFLSSLLDLSDEVLLRIFSFLPFDDLKSLILVNKKLRDVCVDPILWRKFAISSVEISKEEDGLEELHKVIKLPRFSKLQTLDLSRVLSQSGTASRSPECRQIFREILETANKLPLVSLDLSHNSLGSVSLNFLATLFLKIPHVELVASTRSMAIVSKVLENYCAESKLTSLYLGGNTLSGLSTNLVAKLNCLVSLSLDGSFLTVGQIRVLLTSMASTSNCIKKFKFRPVVVPPWEASNWIQHIDSDLLATVVVQMQQFVWKCPLSTEHMRVLLEKIVRQAPYIVLRKLDLGTNDVSVVGEELLDSAVRYLRMGGGRVVLKRKNRKIYFNC